MKVKAEVLKNYVGQNVKVSFVYSDEVAVPTGHSFTYETWEGTKTIEGNVFLHEGDEMILEDDGTVVQFNDKNIEITLEVL